jgi:hypothetical protein
MCFTSPPKEDVLRICDALKNPLLSAGFKRANLRSGGKHDNLCAIINDFKAITRPTVEFAYFHDII